MITKDAFGMKLMVLEAGRARLKAGRPWLATVGKEQHSGEHQAQDLPLGGFS